MALHEKNKIRHMLDGDIYASAELSRCLTKYRFPEPECDPRIIYAAVHDELMLDGNSRQNLATFCQTWEEPELHKLMDECIGKNIVDKDEYPVQALSDALDQYQEATGLDVPIHVDGASGGFLAPFCVPGLVWDFRLPRVKSINASGHKFGLAPLGVGWVVWRDRQDLPEELIFRVNYLGGELCDIALNFSRPGGQIVCQYYNFLRLGKEGYRKIHTACYESAQYLAAEIEKLGLFEVIYSGSMDRGIPAVCWTIKAGAGPGFSLFDLADRLRNRGWQVPAYPLPANCQGVVVQRVLVRHGVTRDLCSLLAGDIKRALGHFRQHPVNTSLTEAEASGFHH